MERIMKLACRISIFLLLLMPAGMSAAAWMPDSLGAGYEMRYVEQPADYSGAVRCTIIRHLSDVPTDKAILYIHGYNDYYFQKELAQQFAGHDYDFYAVDLRKYGRSILSGQKPFLVRDISEYYADVDSALAIMVRDGSREIVLMGHSTGGLVASCYMVAHPQAPVRAMILNSPFLDWNLGRMECLVGIASALGKIFPNIHVDTGGGGVYEQALTAGEHGEWTFNHAWKGTSLGVNLGWVRAINLAQKYLRKHPYDIKCPILLMYSARSLDPDKWTPEASRADVVLDVADIRKYGRMLGRDVTSVAVEGGMHDLILSALPVRSEVYKYIFYWLGRNLK
ncbi:MAG: alpha/beta hydrolase [Muribaculaceae bacterium]|nr:alpha/beta hydrolase [Muribaculaceae bacterium]